MLLLLCIVAVVDVGLYVGMSKMFNPFIGVVLESVLDAFGMIMDNFQVVVFGFMK